MNKANLLFFAEYAETLDPALYDQTKTIWRDGGPSCLVAHLLEFFGDDADASDPRAAREAAARILGLDYCATASLYGGRPFGFGNLNPTPKEAAMVLRRLADDKGATWIRDGRGD